MNKKAMVLYSIGSIGEGAGYNVFGSFFIYFLTVIAGVPPMIAGTISMVGMLWDAVTDPLIGYFSDNSRSKHGRRRGFIRVGSILLLLSMPFMFWDIPSMSLSVKMGYFSMLSILFWLVYTITDVPYLSLGSEIAKTYEERSVIRGAAYTCCNIGYILGGTLVLPMVAWFTTLLGSDANGWRGMGVVLAVITGVGYYVSYLGTKGHDVVQTEKAKGTLLDIVKQYGRIFAKNKSAVILCLLTFFVDIAIALYLSVQMFLFQFNFLLTVAAITTVMLIGNFASIVMSSVIGGLAAKFGKKPVMIIGLILYASGMMVVKVLPAGFAAALVVVLLIKAGNTTFFSQVYSFAYDTGEINRFHFGEKMDGALMALIGLSYKVGSAVGVQLSGIALEMTGFDGSAAVQTPGALAGIEAIFSYCSAAAVAVGLIIFLLYPMSKERFDRLKEANDRKDQGLEYDHAAAARL